ncbi:BREX-2 system phosphatase PglZ [Nocardiopsis sp. RV163]|uniref:BREX-2 system phosphatase PglZ n=1 Tax=Nocardiopsis sp. RV163 TaxID=1661388 RepID=UPI00064BD20D|nr:BREX-2 system phosphatase PglZ [Nocardiopsis sp. RV163]
MSTITHGSGPAPAAPALGRVTEEAVLSAVERVLRAERKRVSKGHPASASRALALSADPHWDGPETLTLRYEGTDLTVRVAGADSVLAAVRALSLSGGADEYLVLLTPREPAEFGEALLGRFLGEDVLRLNSWELLATDLRISGVDPRLYSRNWSWLADTLRGIRATRPLRLGAGVLKLEQALSIAVSVRFGGDPGDQVDGAALLEWSRDPNAVAAFTRLHEDEREALRDAVERNLGAVPRVLFRLLDRGQVLDAVPIGLVLSELADAAGNDQTAHTAWIRAQERYFGAHQPGAEDTADFSLACVAALLRLLDGHDQEQAAETIRRAEELLAELDAVPVARASRLLDAGLHSRLADLGHQITLALGGSDGAAEDSPPLPQDLREVEAALERLRGHRRHDPGEAEGRAALDAVRLLRRLAGGTAQRPLGADTPATAHQWIQTHVHHTGWVDRAASGIWHTGTQIPELHQALETLYRRVRAWRGLVDAEFARVVNRWNGNHAPSDTQPRAENLLAQFARPLAGERKPLVVVLDGMSVEVAVQLAEEVNARGRLAEIGRVSAGTAGREGALATVPSTTNCSRASLLTGGLTVGKQDKERSGFTALWATPAFGRSRAVLYHQRDLESGAGLHLPPKVQEALDDTDTVVGVVLNTIDDALAKGREGNSQIWRLHHVGKLGTLLDAAARAGRPVVLTSDHGHVWDRGDGAKTQSGESARYRTGEAGTGEVLATGDRVLLGDGRLVVPHQEGIRYTDRKEGYHGGFSAAEMVIPVLVFLPAPDQAPKGWDRLTPARTEPAWWSQALEGASTGAAAAAAAAQPAGVAGADPDAPGKARGTAGGGRPRRQPVPDQTPALFGDDALAPRTLGAKVVGSTQFELSRKRVAKAPSAEEIAAVIDALAAVDETHPRLPVSAVARAAGKPEAAHRAVRFVKMVSKVLNVEAYPVLTLPDGERNAELNTALLRQQFLSGGS